MFLAVFLFGALAFAATDVDLAKLFADRDACFVVQDLDTGKPIHEFNQSRCGKRFSPYSTFKIPAALAELGLTSK